MNHGISIDIYPVFHLADIDRARSKQIRFAMVYLLLVVGEPPKHHGVLLKAGSRVILALLRGKLREKVKQRCFEEMKKYQSEDTKFRTALHSFTSCRKSYPAECFEDEMKTLFVDEEFSIPKEYDKFLSIRYGDYMKIPPVEEQGVKLDHIVKIDIDHSYLDYKGKLYCVK